MRVIIVEDEEPATNLILNYLKEHSDLEVLGNYSDGFAGAKAVNQLKPDLLLLDIQLPRLNGFELLEILEHTPQVIFTTAYDEYAIKAFEQNATDYLLKPFSQDRFSQALDRAREKHVAASTAPTQEASAIASNLTQNMPLTRIVVKDSKGIHVIPTQELLYLEAQEDYVMIYTAKGRYIKKQTLKHYEQRLDGQQFVRIHRSYIANTIEIARIEPYEKDGHLALLKNGAKLKVSSSGYKNLKGVLGF